MIPTRRTALKARVRGEEVYLAFHIARKPYRCPQCGGLLRIGEEGVMARWPGYPKSADHRHLHTDCADEMSVGFQSVEEIPAAKASEGTVNKKAAKRRRKRKGRRNP